MDSSMYNQWVQSPIQDAVPHELAAIINNSSSATTDINDFTTLTDLAAPSSVSQTFYPPYGSYYIQAPYTTMAYGTPWPTSVPLSNYSSLNGATTSSSSQSQSQSQSQNHGQSQSQQQQSQQQQQQQQQQSLAQQQQSPQQQHLSPQIPHQTVQMQNNTAHMIIDPVLTLNGSSSSSMQPSFSLSPSFTPSQPQAQQPQAQQSQQSQQQQQQMQQQRTQFYGHLMYASPYYRQQPQSAPQGTLSPQALHSPTNSLMSMIPQTFMPHQIQSPIQTSPSLQQQQQQSQPQQQQNQLQSLSTISLASTSVAHTSTDGLQVQSQQPPAQPQGLTPEARESRKRAFEVAIRPLLQPSAFSGAQAVNTLTSLIADYGATDVDAAMRLEILARIRDGAGNHYYRAWSENATAMDITREWIKASAKGNNAVLVETTMPLLHLIDRLPLNVETLRTSKLGKIILKLVKDEPSSAIKDMASNLERRWRSMVSEAEGGAGNVKAPENKGNEDAKTKKRKLADPAQPKPSQASKKAALGSSSSTKPTSMKREPNAVASSSKSAASSSLSGGGGAGAGSSKDAAKADSSFFSAPKQKAKLPSFKKAPPSSGTSIKKDEIGMMGPGMAMPSSFDPFQDVLKSMNRRKDSPAVSTPPSASGSGSGANAGEGGSGGGQPGQGKTGKRKKTVTWANDDQLESVKIIERAVYDDDPVDGTHVTHSLRDLDRGEGAALHSRLFEETGDWAEPMPLALSPETPERGGQSEEKETQEEREQTALSAMYMSANQIPDSPAEPTNVMSEEEVDRDVTQMTAGPEMDAVFWAPTEPVLPPTAVAVPAGTSMPGIGTVPGVPAPSVPGAPSVADLVGQLASMDPNNAMMGVSPNGVPGVVQNHEYGAYQSMPQEQLQQLLQTLAVYGTAGAANSTDASWASGSSNPYGADYGNGNGYHEDVDIQQPRAGQWPDGRGRGGRGRGRGRGRGEEGYRPYIKRKPCSFFAAGRCKYGDQCDFAHDPSNLYHDH